MSGASASSVNDAGGQIVRVEESTILSPASAEIDILLHQLKTQLANRGAFYSEQW